VKESRLQNLTKPYCQQLTFYFKTVILSSNLFLKRSIVGLGLYIFVSRLILYRTSTSYFTKITKVIGIVYYFNNYTVLYRPL